MREVTEQVEGSPDRTAPDPGLVERLRHATAALLETTPDLLVPVDLAAAAARSWVVALSPQEVAGLVRAAFADLRWPEDRAGAAGLSARLEWARLSTDPEPDADLDGVRRAAARAVEGSDAAAAAGRPGLALDRWCDGWELLYHRELHTDVPSSPLVDDPRRWLSPLLAGAVFRGWCRPRPRAPAGATRALAGPG